MENPNWNADSLEANLKLHLTAAAFILEQLINRHGEHTQPRFLFLFTDDHYEVRLDDGKTPRQVP